MYSYIARYMISFIKSDIRVWGKFWNGVLESWKVQWRLSLASRIHLWNQVFDPSYGSKVTNYSQMSYLDTSIWPNCVFSRYFKLCRNRIRHLVRMIITFKLHYRVIPRCTYIIPYCRQMSLKWMLSNKNAFRFILHSSSLE